MRRVVRIATRGSALALAQAEAVRAALRAHHPEVEAELVVVKTSGDLKLDRPLAELGRESGEGKGLFTKEIEEALLAGAADIAVHSMKDLPVEPAPGLVVAAVPARENPADCLVSKYPGGWRGLPPGAVMACGSPRRAAQFQALRPDVRIQDIRGNVPTRLRKTANDERVAATILARAGLARLGIIASHTALPCQIEAEGGGAVLFVTEFGRDEMLPAPGQGAIAVQCRESDTEVRALCAALHDAAASREARIERSLLAALGGGCHMAFGAGVAMEGEREMRVWAFLRENGRAARVTAVCAADEQPEECATRVARMLREALRGANGREELRGV